MDFWRAYQVLTRRKWIIVSAVIVTTLLVSIGVMLFGRKWDGTAWFGPSDVAVRRAVNASNENSMLPVTDDARFAEAYRIGTEITAPDNAATAVYGLASASALRDQLSAVLGSPVYNDPSQAPNYDVIQSKVMAAMRKMPLGVKQEEPEGSPGFVPSVERLQRSSTLKAGLWTDYIYLYSKLEFYNIPRDFLRPDRLTETITAVMADTGMAVLNARNITLTVRHRDKHQAEIWVNARLAAYKYAYDAQARGAAMKNVHYYQREFAEAAKNFERAKKALYAFRQKNKTIFMPDQINSAIKRTEAARNEIDHLNSSIKDMDAQLGALKSRWTAMPRQLKKVYKADNPEIGALQERINALEVDKAAELGNHTDKHPNVVRLQAQIDSLKQRLNRIQGSMVTSSSLVDNPEWVQMQNDIATMEQSRRGYQARLQAASQTMSQQSAIIDDLPESSVAAQAVQNTYAAAGERVASINWRLSQARDELQKATAQTSLEVRYWAGDPPGTENHPENPATEGAKKKNFAMIIAAFLMSLIGAGAIVLGLDFLDNSIKNSVDVERMLDVPVNGVVPRLDAGSKVLLPQVTHKLPSSPHAESYRFLGTDILLSANGDEPFKTIMVATAKPGQGGTSTICNLAITLAQAGQSVVLVDADLRRPSLHRVFDLENEQGLTTVLGNGKLPSDVLQRTEIDNLYVMPGGPRTDNAWKLLRSSKMRDVIQDLSRDFDFVLFDTPSAVVFADAATLATMVDGVLLVVRAHEAPSGSELQVKNLLNKTKARIVGVVLNDMPVQTVDSARFFSHYYAPGTPRQEALADPPAVAAATAETPRPALPKRPTHTNDDDI